MVGYLDFLLDCILREGCPQSGISVQHNLKKIRNNLMKSGNRPYHTQLLKMKGNTIIWDHWVSAFRWDIKQHSLPVHYRLTEKHIFPTTQEKMRNALAEDCLDKEMLHLMQVED